MKKLTICLFGLGIALVCFTQTVSAQTFVAKESNYHKMKVVTSTGQGKHWNQVTQEVRHPYRGHHGFYPPRPVYGPPPHHVAPPRPPRHHYYHAVPAPRVYVPVYPVYPHHGQYSHDRHPGFSIQIDGPRGGFYFRN